MHLVIGHIAHQSRNRWFAQRPYNLPGMNQFYEKEIPFKRGSVMADYGASPLVFYGEGKPCILS